MKWQKADIDQWFQQQEIKRSYLKEVVSKIEKLKTHFEVSSYGALSINPQLYPLFLLKSKRFDPKKKTVLITGGVHGYETSGVHGALAFFEREASSFSNFNFVGAPCISPWAYETINRWNNLAIDPNRSFFAGSPAEECDFFLKAVSGIDFFAHFDLHETTDTDNTVFRPAKAARDGVEEKHSEIPDGFYVVGDSLNPQPAFQRAVIDAVREVTHIAKADANMKIIGAPLEQEGVINYPVKKLFLCAGFSNADFVTTTEVYPDSPKVTDQICIDAQVAAVVGGLRYLISASRR